MGFLSRRQPSERQAAEKNLARGGVPEFRSPSPRYQGKGANYVVKGGRGGRDRSGVAYVIPPGGRTAQQERDEEENRIMRGDWRR
jgi:hypothetical protein